MYVDVPGKLNESYRYSKCFDNGFLRETLLEHYSPDEVHEAVPEYETSAGRTPAANNGLKSPSATQPTGANDAQSDED